MRMFNAIVGDVWREQEAEARKLRKDTERCLADVDRRVDQLERAYIFEKRIDQGTYERQKDKHVTMSPEDAISLAALTIWTFLQARAARLTA